MRLFFISLILLAVLGCAQKAPRPEPAADALSDELVGEVLTFLEERPGEPRTMSRVLVTQHYLRIDGEEQGDYVLFDRRRGIIFNVVAEDQSVLVMDSQNPLASSDEPLNWSVSSEESMALPRYGAGSAKAEHFRYQLNGHDCHNVVAIKEFLQDSTAALREYRLALARNLAMTASAGNDAATLCHDAVFLYAPERGFLEGFPLREWDVSGYQRFLQDAKQGVRMPRALFSIPAAYQQYSATDIGR